MLSSVSKAHVAVRARPSSHKEQRNGRKNAIHISPNDLTISVADREQSESAWFAFDKVCNSNASHNDSHKDVSIPIANYFLNGYDAAVSMWFSF